MEREFDLRPFAVAILRKSWQIILVVLLVSLGTGLILAFQPQAAQATSSVLIVPTSNELVLDNRFVTNEGATLVSAIQFRDGLISLAESPALELQVYQLLPDNFYSEPFTSGMLAGAVRVNAVGDLIQFTISASTPERALVLAEAWAQAYQNFLSDLYGRNSGLINTLDVELESAQVRYEQAQSTYETFVANSRQQEIEVRITELTGLQESLVGAEQRQYDTFINRLRELELVREDALTLREQLIGEEIDSLSSTITMLALRSRSSGNAILPIEIQISSTEALTRNTDDLLLELDNFLLIIEQRIGEIEGQANLVAQRIATAGVGGYGVSTAERAQIITELRSLYGQREQIVAQRGVLETQRNLALEALSVIESKRVEQEIARASQRIESRYVPAANIAPVGLRRLALPIGAAFVVTLVLAVTLVLFFEFALPALRQLSAQPQPSKTPAPRSSRRIAGD